MPTLLQLNINDNLHPKVLYLKEKLHEGGGDGQQQQQQQLFRSVILKTPSLLGYTC